MSQQRHISLQNRKVLFFVPTHILVVLINEFISFLILVLNCARKLKTILYDPSYEYLFILILTAAYKNTSCTERIG